jgi:protein-disulfide isomerase
MARMNSPEVQAVIDENQRLGGLLAISGTPTFVIDQTLLRGYVPLDGMREIVAGQRG